VVSTPAVLLLLIAAAINAFQGRQNPRPAKPIADDDHS
jgi:hypothetical protein